MINDRHVALVGGEPHDVELPTGGPVGPDVDGHPIGRAPVVPLQGGWLAEPAPAAPEQDAALIGAQMDAQRPRWPVLTDEPPAGDEPPAALVDQPSPSTSAPDGILTAPGAPFQLATEAPQSPPAWCDSTAPSGVYCRREGVHHGPHVGWSKYYAQVELW